MSDIDKDLQRRLRDFADGISPEPGRSAVVVRSARAKRRLVALSAGLAVVLAIGGIAGGATLLGNRDGIRPAPGPEETSQCVSAGYDLAVFIEDAAMGSEIETLRETLAADSDVDHVMFMSKKAAFQEFKNHYADQPEFWENLPEDALPMSFRVKVVDDADIDAAAGRFKTLDHVEAVRSRGDLSKESQVGGAAPDCPSDTFARYFFEAGSRDASASGFLEVNSEEGTLCYEATTENIQASHLLRNTGVVAGGRRFERTIVVTFFDPGDREQRVGSPSRAGICFQEEDLGELEGNLQVLIEHPEDFRVGFHRGAEDEPGLIAKLKPVGEDDDASLTCEGAEPPPASTRGGLRLRPRQEGSNEVVPIVFPDGTTAELVYLSDMSSDALTVPFDELLARPYPAGGPVGKMIRPQIFYGGIPAEYEADTVVDCIKGRDGPVPVWDSKEGDLIDLVFGRWHVVIFDGREAQEVWARELQGEVVDGGWLVLRGGENLAMGPENDPGDANLMLTLDRTILSLWVLDCEERRKSDSADQVGEDFISYCLEDVDIEVHAQGAPEFVHSVYRNLEVRKVKRTFPLSMYTLLP